MAQQYVAFINPFYRGARIQVADEPLISSKQRCIEHADRWKYRFHTVLHQHHVEIQVLPLKVYRQVMGALV